MRHRPALTISVCAALCAATVAVHVWLTARERPHDSAPPRSVVAAPDGAAQLPVSEPPVPKPEPFLTVRHTGTPAPMILRPDPSLPEKHLPIGESTWTFEAQGHVQFRLLYGYRAAGKKTEMHVLAEAPPTDPEHESAWLAHEVPERPTLVRGTVILHYPAPLVSGWLTVAQDFGSRHHGPLTFQQFFRFPNEPRVLDGWARWAAWDGWPQSSSMSFSTSRTGDGEFTGTGRGTVLEGEVELHEWAQGSSVIEGTTPGSFVRLVVRRIPDARVAALTVSEEYRRFADGWVVESAHVGGVAVEKYKGKRFYFRASKTWYTDRDGSESAPNKYRLNPAKPIKEVDLATEAGTLLGVYELDGDTMRLGLGDQKVRPASADRGAQVYVLKRVK